MEKLALLCFATILAFASAAAAVFEIPIQDEHEDANLGSPLANRLATLEAKLAVLEQMCSDAEEGIREVKDDHVQLIKKEQPGGSKTCGKADFLHALLEEDTEKDTGTRLIATGLAAKVQELATMHPFQFAQDVLKLTDKYENPEETVVAA